MDRDQYTDESYSQPHVPPATPPVIDTHASAHDAATLANDNGDSDYAGSRIASVDRGDEDEGISPADVPDEIVPNEGDIVEPAEPDQIDTERPDDIGQPGGDDMAEPGRTPLETPLPPD
jgi:hypothetical protein